MVAVELPSLHPIWNKASVTAITTNSCCAACLAGYVGKLARLSPDESFPTRNTAMVALYSFSLLDDGFDERIDEEPSIVSLEISARDLWPVFGDGVDSAPMDKTIVRLNDAAMTLATMLISRDEYRTNRKERTVTLVPPPLEKVASGVLRLSNGPLLVGTWSIRISNNSNWQMLIGGGGASTVLAPTGGVRPQNRTRGQNKTARNRHARRATMCSDLVYVWKSLPRVTAGSRAGVARAGSHAASTQQFVPKEVPPRGSLMYSLY